MLEVIQPARRHRFAVIALLLAITAALPASAQRPGDIPQRFDRAWQVQERYQDMLLRRRGVIGVALGENSAGQPVLQLFTRQPGVTGLPAVLDGQAVQVLAAGPFLAGQLAAQDAPGSPQDRWPRPVPIGVSVGHQDVTAGTIGCQVFQGSGCHVTSYILSNNHVLANANLGVIGDQILQPGPANGGTLPNDLVGILTDFEPVIVSPTAQNLMDAAIAYAWNNVGYATPPDGYGAPRAATVSPTINLPVSKYGRTSGMTNGHVQSINARITVTYPGGDAQFVKQFIVTGENNQPFSQGGDSGALVVVASGTNARKVVGLLFAGAGNVAAINPIGPILQRFNVQISGDL